jgi:anti-anti-sigma factor
MLLDLEGHEMAFDAKLQMTGEVATIRLTGELDAKSAPRFNELISQAAAADLGQLVLIADNLSYMSSAGLRCLVFAHQKMPADVRIVVVGAQPEVAETIRLVGFDHSIVLQEAGDPDDRR